MQSDPTVNPAITGIRTKLARAEEHIEYLKVQLGGSVADLGPQDLVNPSKEAAEDFKRLTEARTISPRLTVTSGEAVQQIRSSLDHLICALIGFDGGTIEQQHFPILKEAPAHHKRAARSFAKNTMGITRPLVLDYLDSLQPYHDGAGAPSHWLAILQALSNTDKHRALLVVRNATYRRITIKYRSKQGFELTHNRPDNGEDHPAEDASDAMHFAKLDETRTLHARASFDAIGNPPVSFPAVDALRSLRAAVERVVAECDPLLRLG